MHVHMVTVVSCSWTVYIRRKSTVCSEDFDKALIQAREKGEGGRGKRNHSYDRPSSSFQTQLFPSALYNSVLVFNHICITMHDQDDLATTRVIGMTTRPIYFQQPVIVGFSFRVLHRRSPSSKPSRVKSQKKISMKQTRCHDEVILESKEKENSTADASVSFDSQSTHFKGRLQRPPEFRKSYQL